MTSAMHACPAEVGGGSYGSQDSHRHAMNRYHGNEEILPREEFEARKKVAEDLRISKLVKKTHKLAHIGKDLAGFPLLQVGMLHIPQRPGSAGYSAPDGCQLIMHFLYNPVCSGKKLPNDMLQHHLPVHITCTWVPIVNANANCVFDDCIQQQALLI